MTTIQVTCEHCGTLFDKPLKYVNQNMKRGHRLFCSKECGHAYRSAQARIKTVCANCGKLIQIKKQYVAASKSGNNFCSKKCSAIFNARSGEAHHNFTTGFWSYRQRALDHYGTVCTVPGCGYNIVEVLEVHHRDSDRTNNDIENLDVLCRNHHAEYQLGIRSYPAN